MSVAIIDVQKAAGPLQLCAGQSAGVEAAVHAMRDFYEDDKSEGVLLVDADNAFNRINREAVLWNTQFVCPMLKFFLTNTYRMSRNIFSKITRRNNPGGPPCDGYVQHCPGTPAEEAATPLQTSLVR